MDMKKKIDDIKLTNFPEEVDEQDGVKVYGETSYENQIAFLSHFLHNAGKSYLGGKNELRAQLIDSIYAYLEHKKRLQNYTDEYIAQVADNPFQYDLFKEFFDVTFPSP